MFFVIWNEWSMFNILRQWWRVKFSLHVQWPQLVSIFLMACYSIWKYFIWKWESSNSFLLFQNAFLLSINMYGQLICYGPYDFSSCPHGIIFSQQINLQKIFHFNLQFGRFSKIQSIFSFNINLFICLCMLLVKTILYRIAPKNFKNSEVSSSLTVMAQWVQTYLQSHFHKT